jgi:hypothetical protein
MTANLKTFAALVPLLVGCGANPSQEPSIDYFAVDQAALSSANTRSEIIARAKSAVGYSYWWGGAAWDPNGASYGGCSGSCPNCTHSGKYGADCSGLAGKVWVVPSSNWPLTYNYHPYSTYHFYNEHHGWHDISRGSEKKGDALVYNTSGAGHIFIYAKGDSWGTLYAYECKGCAAGCVYDSRTASSAYKAISRDGATDDGPADGPKVPASLEASGKCADIDHSQVTDGTKVQIWNCNSTSAQAFTVTAAGELRTAFDTCVDVTHSGTEAGTKVQEFTCNGTGAQKWTFKDVAILSALGKCIDVPSSNWASGQAVQLYDCNGTGAQRWAYDPATGALHGQNGLCLDVKSGSTETANGTVVQVYTCNGTVAQQWTRGAGGFRSAVATNKCLDVNGAATANGTKIQIWDCNGTDAQRFALRGAIHGIGGNCLDIPSSDTTNGNQLQMWTCNGTGAQTWNFWSP